VLFSAPIDFNAQINNDENNDEANHIAKKRKMPSGSDMKGDNELVQLSSAPSSASEHQ
jgi:hypothetical protein